MYREAGKTLWKEKKLSPHEDNAVLTQTCFYDQEMWVRCEPTQFKEGRITMMTIAKKFLKDENGATAIEYGLIAALVAVAIVGALTTLGGGLTTMFGKVNSDL